jgi:hypothetical protein
VPANTWIQVAALENTAPAASWPTNSGSRRARLPSDATVAVLETKPDTKPDAARPNRGPATRSATWPTACSNKISNTIAPSGRRLIPPSHACGVFGSSGRNTRPSAASISASRHSSLLSQWVANQCKRWRAASSSARPAPQAAPSGGDSTACTPMR